MAGISEVCIRGCVAYDEYHGRRATDSMDVRIFVVCAGI